MIPRLRTLPLPGGDVLLILDRWSGGPLDLNMGGVNDFFGVSGLMAFQEEVEIGDETR